MRIKALVLAALVLALLTCQSVFAYEEDTGPPGITAQFYGGAGMAEDLQPVQFSGTILATSNQMKFDVLQNFGIQHQATSEQITVLVDFKERLLIVLYPDTLNGLRYRLNEFDHINGFDKIHEALNGNQPDLPEGWEETELGEVELGGELCMRRRALSPEGLAVELWTNGDNRPVRVVAQHDKYQLIVSLHDFVPVDHTDMSAFLIPEDYTITSAEDDIPEGLPPL